MYKIFLKRTSTSRNLFDTYAEIAESEETATEFQTDDFTELAEKYRELLNMYPALQMKAVQELDTEILVNIVDE